MPVHYTFAHSYTETDRTNQYEHTDYNNMKRVPAIYREPLCQEDVGNPLIEALPYPREYGELFRSNTKRIYVSPLNRVQKMTRLEKCGEMSALRSLRLPFLFHNEIERALSESITSGYRKRFLTGDRDQEICYYNNNERKQTCVMTVANPSEATDSGVSILGFSGCGKSAAITMALDHYPQVIWHKTEDCSFLQVVYLVVSCKPCSNLDALYNAIADQLDIVLGNLSAFTYKEQMQKKRGIEAKAQYLIDLIRICNIGTIILDEIQFIDFSANKPNSYATLLMISNETKMPFTVIGTSEAYNKMFKNLKVARRVGDIIDASAYCRDRQIFRIILNTLFSMQWFSEIVPLTHEMAESFYQGSKGIIDQIIRLYYCVHIRYFNQMENLQNFYQKKGRKKIEETVTGSGSVSEACMKLNEFLKSGELPPHKSIKCHFIPVGDDAFPVPVVDTSFIEETKREYMREMIKLLDELDAGDSTFKDFAQKYNKISDNIDTRLKSLSAPKNRDIKQDLLEYFEKENALDHTRLLLVENLKACMPNYNINKIMGAAKHAIASNPDGNMSETELMVTAIKWLNNKKSDRKQKKSLPVMK